MHEDLTVRENLSYSAKLRCMATEGRAYLSDVVDDVIELLGLRHVQHSVVGSVEKRGVRQAPSLSEPSMLRIVGFLYAAQFLHACTAD